MAAPLRLFWRLSGLAALLGAWALIHAVYGPFVLPRPGEAFTELARLFESGTAQTALVSTGVPGVARLARRLRHRLRPRRRGRP